MRYFVRLGNAEHCVAVSHDGTSQRLSEGDQSRVTTIHGAPGAYRVVIDGRVIDLSLRPMTSATPGTRTFEVQGLGTIQLVEVCSERDRQGVLKGPSDKTLQRSIVAQMPGRVLSVGVRAGDRVSKGQALIVIEAMKMENELYADDDLTVLQVLVNSGDAVDAGVALLLVQQGTTQ